MTSDIQSVLHKASHKSQLGLPGRTENMQYKDQPVVVVNNLRHGWTPEHVLFQAETLTWHRGSIIWLKGENGSGKSTLMRLLSGLEPLQSGEFDYPGIRPSLFRASGRGRICYLHQMPYLFAGTVRKNLDFVVRSMPADKRKLALNKMEHGIELAALEHLTDQVATTLSGGERQRLALLRAWLLSPEVLYLDEPAANLDEKSVQLICGMVTDLIQQGTAVMFSSHQNCALTSLANASWVIRDGTIHASYDV